LEKNRAALLKEQAQLNKELAKEQMALAALAKAENEKQNADWLEPFKAALLADGLIGKKDKSFQLKITHSKIWVNGKKLNDAQTEKYLALYAKVAGCSVGKDDVIQVHTKNN
jgi:hypothetical protein